MINITFPDGAVREFESGVTTFEIAQSISNSLAKKALAGKFNGKLIDTTRAITEDSKCADKDLFQSCVTCLCLTANCLFTTLAITQQLRLLTPATKTLFQSCVTQRLTCLPKQLVAFSQIFIWCWSSHRRWFLLRY